jgi:sec-independent protein translocase protein TatA
MPFIGGHLWVLLVILLIVLVIWGPGKLPDLGSGIARAITGFRKGMREDGKKEADGGEAQPAKGDASPPARPK